MSTTDDTPRFDEEKLDTPALFQRPAAPDGGLAAWLVVLGTWCTSFCSFGWLNSIGAFQDYYEIDLLQQYSPSTISWIPSLQIFFMMGLGPVVGYLYDRAGTRVLLAVGSILHVFGIMMTSLGTQYYQILLAQGVCSATGVACIFQPAVMALGGWFDGHRGAAFGVAFTGSSLGGVVFPILVTKLISAVGFGWAMRIAGFVILFLLVIANLTVRAYVPPGTPKSTGAKPAPPTPSNPFKEMNFLFLMAGFFLFSYGFFVVIDYLPIQALAAGMDANLAGYMLPILNAGSLFGRLASGFTGDKLGRYNVFIIVCFLTGIWTLCLWLPDDSTPALVVFAVLFGFFSGAFVSLIVPLVMQISPIFELGIRSGIIMLTMAISGLTTNPINGAILIHSGYSALKIFAGVFCLAGTFFVLLIRVRQVGWHPLKRF
ncbi:hypothetical protein SEUCBS139899_006581 [Sporothrix eucalyptigena]|uniref:Major facilitator superfamily (MFS) profile domain-containing protein n=1 Tax=Sporothrix eucalyptigena TaxID=1812306 RepID=A0ABP0B376_9PEZI